MGRTHNLVRLHPDDLQKLINALGKKPQILIDDGTDPDTVFVMRFQYDETGAQTIVTELPNGTPYTPIGPVRLSHEEYELRVKDYCWNGTNIESWEILDLEDNTVAVTWRDGITKAIITPDGTQTPGTCVLSVARTLLGSESFSVDTVTGFPTIPSGTGHVEFQAKGGNIYSRTGSVPTAIDSIEIQEGVFNEISDASEITAKQFLGAIPGVTIYAEYWNIPDSVF